MSSLSCPSVISSFSRSIPANGLGCRFGVDDRGNVVLPV